MILFNKNQIHLSVLLIFLSLFVVGAISATFAYLGYQSLLKNINNDTVTKFQNDYRVAQITIQEKFVDEIRNFLDTTSLYIKDIIKQENSVNIETLKQKDIFDPSIDISFVHLYENDQYVEFGLNLYDTKPLIQKLSHANVTDNIKLIKTTIRSETKIVLLESKKLIDPQSGHVVGSLYAGVILNNNFKIAEEVRKVTGLQAVYITYDNMLLLQSTADTISDKLSNDFIKIKPGDIGREKNYVFSKTRLMLNGDTECPLYIVFVNNSNIFEELKKDMLNGIVILFLVSLILFIILEMVMVKLFIRPFSKVHKLALSNIDDHGTYRFTPTAIKELNDIGYSIQSLITSLQESNKNLQKRVEKEVERVKEQQEIIYEQSRQSALSELLVNIAHQWRQPLNVISLRAINVTEYIEFKSEQYEEKIIEQAENICRDTENLSSLLTEFTSFYESKDKEQFEVRDSVEQAVRLSGLKEFTVHNRIDPNLIIYGGRKAFIEVLNTIFQNAKDIAFERNAKKPELFIHASTTDDYIKVTVEDNLGGINKEILPKIFDPYTTTKFKSRNKGLGLYLANNLVKYRLSGTITAENSENGAIIVIEVAKNDR